MEDLYRVYFNAHADFPLVCSIDSGDGTVEYNTLSITIDGHGKSVYRGERQPKFWIEIYGELSIIDGQAFIKS